MTSSTWRAAAMVAMLALVPACGGSPSSPGMNAPPSVRILTPQDGTTSDQGRPITISASASDTDGAIAQVDFFGNGVLLGTAAAPPFSLVWQDPPAGSILLTALAVDDAGARTPSAPVAISVTASETASGGEPTGAPTASTGWVLSSPAGFTTDLYGVAFADADVGWVVGASGTILHTVDGGATWSPQPSGTTNMLKRVQFVSPTRGWVVGLSGTVLSTADGGKSWTNVSPSTRDFAGLSFVNASTGWVVGGDSDGGILYRTTDGGTTWTSPGPPTPFRRCGAVSFLDADHGFVGAVGEILSTTDAGGHWTRLPMTVQGATGDFPDFFYDGHFRSPTVGTFVGQSHNGDLLATTLDGGASWTSKALQPPPESINGVALGDDGHWWAAGSIGRILMSADRGATWTAQQTPTFNHLNGIGFVDGSRGWAVGFGGVILRTTTGGTGPN